MPVFDRFSTDAERLRGITLADDVGAPADDSVLVFDAATNTWTTEPAGAGDALTANPLSQFAATTSLQLAGVLSDETGSGAAVFANSPTLVTPALGTPSALVGTNITGTAAGLTVGATTGVEAGADVTDATNVAAAGALMANGTVAMQGNLDFDGFQTQGLTTFLDPSSNTILIIETKGASAVNYLKIANSLTTLGPTITAEGSDTNIDINLIPKGSGDVNVTPTGDINLSAAGTKVNAAGKFTVATTIELGDASDTTLSRVSAGVVAIEGSNILVSGGALGTPASGTLSNCTVASATAKGVVELATQAEVDAGTDAARVVTPETLAGYSGLGGGGGLTSTAGSDADVAMAVGNMYEVDMSGWATADRVYSLPTTAAVGDQVGVMVTSGSASYELDLRTTAASNDTINGVDHDTTSWSRLFITGETVIFRCVTANADWVVEVDGRIPCVGILNEGAADTPAEQDIGTNYTWHALAYSTGADSGVGDIADNTNDRINLRRDGKYLLTAGVTIDDIDQGEFGICSIAYDKSGTPVEICRSSQAPAGSGQSIALTAALVAELTVATHKNVFTRAYHNEGGNTPVAPSWAPRWITVTEVF